MEDRIVGRVREVVYDRAGVIERPYNITSEALKITRAVEEMIPNEGLNGQKGREETSAILGGGVRL